jgi:hypothetical protein
LGYEVVGWHHAARRDSAPSVEWSDNATRRAVASAVRGFYIRLDVHSLGRSGVLNSIVFLYIGIPILVTATLTL